MGGDVRGDLQALELAAIDEALETGRDAFFHLVEDAFAALFEGESPERVEVWEAGLLQQMR